MKRILFICGENRRRSPTAEEIFADREDIEVLSAGLNQNSVLRVTPDLLEWADIIFVMEKRHLSRLRTRFGQHLNNQSQISLNIPDDYDYMDKKLVELLNMRVSRHLQSF